MPKVTHTPIITEKVGMRYRSKATMCFDGKFPHIDYEQWGNTSTQSIKKMKTTLGYFDVNFEVTIDPKLNENVSSN